MEAKMIGGNVMKGNIVISLILLAGLASAYTPEQQTTLEGMNLSIQYGMAYEKAIQGQNVNEFNALVDEYNAWIRLHFGEDANLLKSKINAPAVAPSNSGAVYLTQPSNSGIAYLTAPFNASTDLSKFGNKQHYVANSMPEQGAEYDISQQEARNFISS